MAPTAPILSTGQDLLLPDLESTISSSSIPASAELATLNSELAGLAALALARADALKRDIELLQQTYASLRSRVRKENEDRLSQATSISHAATNVGVSKSALVENQIVDQEGVIKIKQEASADEDTVPLSTGSSAPLRQSTPKAQPYISVSLPELASPAMDLSPTTDPEEMRRRLGVAYYPTVDLSNFLPGTPSTEDYSKQKIPNQVAITTFQAHVEPFFRPFTEEDIGWLRDPGDRLAPFIIPPLGTHYAEIWNDTDEVPPVRSEATQKPKESAENLTDENLYSDSVSCGPLTSRIISALIKEDESTANGEDADVQEKEKSGKLSAFKMDYSELEDRMNSELTYMGLLDPSPVDWGQVADDEISSSLRALQSQLKTQSILNASRKRKLMDLTTDEMAKDEYTTILDDLDKQVEQSFIKRTRSIKAKKKRTPGEKGVAIAKVGLGSSIRALCEKRQKWITKIGVICLDDRDRSTKLPPIFEDLDAQQNDDDRL